MKYLNKTIEYGLYLLAFLLPLGTRWIIKPGFTEYQSYSLYGTDILLVIILLLFIVREIAASPNYRLLAMTDKKIVLPLALIAITAISAFFAADKSLALYKLGWLMLGVGLFWLIARAEYSRVKLIWSLLFGLAIQAGLGIWQFFNQAAPANKWFGLAAHLPADLGAVVIETFGAGGVVERWLRAYGGFDHPNILGGAMAIGIILIIMELFIEKKYKTILNGLLVLFSAGLFFSFSRSAWLALAGGVGALMMFAVFKKDLIMQKIILKAALVIGLSFFILFLIYPGLVLTRLKGSERLEIKSNSERIASLKDGFGIIKNNWLLGAGFGNYTIALNQKLPGQTSYFYQPVHNTFLLVFSELGVVGFLLFIVIIFSLLRRPFTERELTVTTCLIILLNLDHWLWSLHFGVIFFGCSWVLCRGKKKKFKLIQIRFLKATVDKLTK